MILNFAWSTHPVCAPARTAIIAGLHANSSGGVHMRSSVPMPEGVKMFPEFLREAGYYATNHVKEDYNLPETDQTWDDSSNRAHWRNRKAGQPFFAIFNSTKSHESQMRTRPHAQIVKPTEVRVPAYHPDLPEVRQDWAQYYDKVSEADADAGMRLREVAAAGLADDTIIFYYGDHGSGMPRGKRWPSNSGLRVPLVVYFPPTWQHLAPTEYAAGGKSGRLVDFVDLAPTLRVTRLAAKGPGSLAAALATPGPRTIEFAVDGVIDFGGSSLCLRQPFVTLAGETAPNPGITLINGGLTVSTHDVIVRHIRIRPGAGDRPRKSGWKIDGLATTAGARDVIVNNVLHNPGHHFVHFGIVLVVPVQTHDPAHVRSEDTVPLLV